MPKKIWGISPVKGYWWGPANPLASLACQARQARQACQARQSRQACLACLARQAGQACQACLARYCPVSQGHPPVTFPAGWAGPGSPVAQHWS